MLGETLENGADNHDDGAKHDGPSSTVAVGKPGGNGDSKDGTELVARVDESKQTGLDGVVAIFVRATLTQVYFQVSIL